MASTLKSQRGKDGGGIGPEETLIAAPLSHGSNPNSNAAGRRREDDENLVIAGPLGGGNDGIGRRSADDPNLVAYAFGSHAGSDGEASNSSHDKGGPVGFGLHENETPALRAGRTQAIAAASVRRLTPRECERLQGLPDDWTDVDGAADSPRYAALGDAVTANVSEWIGGRLCDPPRAADSQPGSDE